MDTLALDFVAWDLSTDAYGNLAAVGDSAPSNAQTGPGMRLAQDVATRCLAWRGEVYFDTSQGVRFEQILGVAPNLSFTKVSFENEALKVPLCQTAIADFTFERGALRRISGSLTVSDVSGNVSTVTFP